MFMIVVVTLVSAGVSFMCSLMEACLYAIPPSKIEQLRQSGHKGGVRLAKLRADVDEPIAAILALNTTANSLGATLAGALVGYYYGNAWAFLYGLLFTMIILFLSEILPKTLGVTYANRLAPAFSLPIVIFIKVFYPLVWLSRGMTRLVRKGHEGGHAPKEDEILALTEMGARMGTLEHSEARWAMNALKLNDATAAEVMTPRTVVYSLPTEMTLLEVKACSAEFRFSIVPVYEQQDLDKVVGIVYRREVFDWLVHKPDAVLANIQLRTLAHPPILVPGTIKCNSLLERFLESKSHLVIVIDEYGGVQGVITLEDVLEFILGAEIVDRYDSYPDMQELARRRGAARIKEIIEAGNPAGENAD